MGGLTLPFWRALQAEWKRCPPPRRTIAMIAAGLGVWKPMATPQRGAKAMTELMREMGVNPDSIGPAKPPGGPS